MTTLEEVLNPSAAQRKAMAQRLYAKYQRSTCWAVIKELVDGMIAAANSIPEGAPVGTIARRPDGEWIAARRVQDEWSYTYVGAFGKPGVEAEWPEADSADSWPQIRPDQWPDPTAQQEPSAAAVQR